MPANYTIKQIIGTEDDGDWTAYGCLLSGDDAPIGQGVRIGHKKGSDFPPPQVGDQLFGEILSRKDGGLYFKRAKRDGGASSNGVRDDTTGRSIERQVALKEAAAMLTPHYKPGSEDDEAFRGAVLQLTDLFHAAIRGEPTQPTLSSAPPSQADESIPF
jgi:hypothetical protein